MQNFDKISGSVLVNLAVNHRDEVQPISLYRATNVEVAESHAN